MPTPDQLRSMDLQEKTNNDEVLSYAQWIRKEAIHVLAKNSYQSDKPLDDGDWWRYALNCEGGTAAIPKCHLLIAVARLKAYIPQGGRANTDLDMPEEGFLVKKKLAEWSKKQMFFTKAVEKDYKHMEVPALTASYSVQNYDGYVPIPILDAIEFIAKHIADVPKLKKEHITVSFSVVKCGLPLAEEEQVMYHCKQIHGLDEGITSLSPLQVITVDKDQTFSCPALHMMEDSGPEQRSLLTNSVYNKSVAKVGQCT